MAFHEGFRHDPRWLSVPKRLIWNIAICSNVLDQPEKSRSACVCSSKLWRPRSKLRLYNTRPQDQDCMRIHDNLHYGGSSQLKFDDLYKGAESWLERCAMKSLE